MPETTVEKATCENCGVEAREGTTFCYNCGTPVLDVEKAEAANNGEPAAVSAEAQAALDELSQRFKIDKVKEEDKLAQAAAERKRARVRARRSEVVWEPVDNTMWFVLFTLAITVLTAVVVFVAVYWK